MFDDKHRSWVIKIQDFSITAVRVGCATLLIVFTMVTISDAVINGLLCFVSTARHSHTETALTSICLSFYNSEKHGLQLAYRLANETYVARRGDGRLKSDLMDILALFNKCELNNVQLPKFLADGFDTMPPMSGYEILAEHIVDLVTQVSELKQQVKTLNESALDIKATNVAEVKEDLHDIKTILLDKPSQFHKKAMACSPKESYSTITSGPHKQSKSASVQGNNQGKDGNVSTEDSNISFPSGKGGLPFQLSDSTFPSGKGGLPFQLSDSTFPSGKCRLPLLAEPTEKEVLVTEDADEDNSRWQVVSRQRRKKNGIHGSKKCDSGIRGVKRTMDIYIGRLDPPVSGDDLTTYIENDLGVNLVSCSCLSKLNAEIKSFKVTVNADDGDKLLDGRLWPDNIIVRKFFSTRNNGGQNH